MSVDCFMPMPLRRLFAMESPWHSRSSPSRTAPCCSFGVEPRESAQERNQIRYRLSQTCWVGRLPRRDYSTDLLSSALLSTLCPYRLSSVPLNGNMIGRFGLTTARSRLYPLATSTSFSVSNAATGMWCGVSEGRPNPPPNSPPG